ncbi:hypothetical protein PDIG_90600 [Penicillium digitatum PHI26]|uniref:Uncharacterized protein n=2 Tax=Penicillium digitatum TaxID=36651 RepID=K9FSY3_PEND2|nr:hypothetical protein PDIP_07520 [Penicillium digitatum Pd1]EKV04196.1 hypothetical protein PDIG_90600 [Penicillium digitatum PHI26]EKV21323.1 hypothetical protein PDIP_07520 [Penicillium digitatum Pd1]
MGIHWWHPIVILQRSFVPNLRRTHLHFIFTKVCVFSRYSKVLQPSRTRHTLMPNYIQAEI